MARKGNPISVRLDLNRSSDSSWFSFKFLVMLLKESYKLIGVGAAILAAYLALACAAWYLDLPDLLSFFLLNGLYWFYIYIYIFFFWGGVYEKTKGRSHILQKLLFQKMKRALTLERQALMFFLQIGFLIASFALFVWCYKLMFPEIEKGNLVNPLQVIAQVSCFLFNFKYPEKPARVRHLLLLCFFFSLTSSLHLQGIRWEVISLLFFLFCINFILFPLNYVQKIVFLVYFLKEDLAKWGFFLAFQQVAYCGLSFFLEKEQSGASSKKRLFSFFLLLLIQLVFGYYYYGDLYLKDPLKLAALLSGACIIFISLAKRATWAFLLVFFFYFLLSVFIGKMSSPGDIATIWGIPHGILIFFFIHLCAFFGLFFFYESLPRGKQPLIPLFFGGVFFLLAYFPELAWLEKWIEGIDLLLLVLGVFSFIEGEESNHGHPRK